MRSNIILILILVTISLGILISCGVPATPTPELIVQPVPEYFFELHPLPGEILTVDQACCYISVDISPRSAKIFLPNYEPEFVDGKFADRIFLELDIDHFWNRDLVVYDYNLDQPRWFRIASNPIKRL